MRIISNNLNLYSNQKHNYTTHSAPTFKMSERNIIPPKKDSYFKTLFNSAFDKLFNHESEIKPSKIEKEAVIKEAKPEVKAVAKTETKVGGKAKNEFVLEKPEFSFDLDRLKEDLSETDKIDGLWIEQNPSGFKNLQAALGIKSDIKDMSNDFKASLLNASIKDKTSFIKEAETKHAQEKRVYIDSIRKYLKYNDKEANIQSLKALEKYGSWEDCENLGGYIGERDPEIIRQFVKTVGAIGKHKHSMLVTSFLRPMHKLNSDILVDILNAESKIGRVSDQKWVEPFLSHEDESVRKAAQNTVEKIKEMNNTDAAF